MVGPNMQVTVSADTTKFTNGMARASGRLTKFGSVARSVARGVAVAAAAMLYAFGRFAKDAINDASSLQQSLGGVESVYKKFAGQMITQSELAAEKVGLSMEQYQRVGVLTGTLLKNAGIPMKKLASQTDILVTLAADLAATFGGSVEEAANAMNAALRGEFEPIRKFGIALSQAQIQEEALTLSHKNSITELTKRDKILATQSLLLKQGADASGQFARESDTLANRQQVLNAKWENLSATMGEKLLPIAEVLSEALIDLVDSKGFKDGMDRMLKGFEDFGIWLESPEGIEAVAKLGKAFESMLAITDLIVQALGWIGGWLGGADAKKLADSAKFWSTVGGSQNPITYPPYAPSPITPSNGPGKIPPVTVNFNSPIDSVSAGREVSRVLNEYNRSNGGRR